MYDREIHHVTAQNSWANQQIVRPLPHCLVPLRAPKWHPAQLFCSTLMPLQWFYTVTHQCFESRPSIATYSASCNITMLCRSNVTFIECKCAERFWPSITVQPFSSCFVRICLERLTHWVTTVKQKYVQHAFAWVDYSTAVHIKTSLRKR